MDCSAVSRNSRRRASLPIGPFGVRDCIFSHRLDLALEDFGVRVLKTPIQAPKVKAEFPVDLGARQIPKGQVLQPASVASRNVELSASCPRRLLNPRPVFGYVAKVITIAHQISIR
jgi:hypothetical protein